MFNCDLERIYKNEFICFCIKKILPHFIFIDLFNMITIGLDLLVYTSKIIMKDGYIISELK